MSSTLNQSQVSDLIEEIQEASRLLKDNRRGDALLIYHDVKTRTERHPGVEFSLGRLCEEFGDIDEAIVHYEVVVEEVPDNIEFLTVLGIAYLISQRYPMAKATLDKALEINPDIAEVQHGLGNYYMHRSDYENAIVHLERACEIRPRDIAARINLAMSLSHLNRHEPALKNIERAYKLDSKDPGVLMAKSDLLAQVGDMEGATKIVEGVIAKNPTLGRAYDHYARMKKFTADDAPLMKKAEKLLEQGMAPKERCNILFALGKMNDDCGNYDEAFSFFERGNLMRKGRFDLSGDEKVLKGSMKAFSAKAIEEFARFGNDSSQPVFIVGMPRSGTTLMERIIASHPQGAGSGELLEIPEISRKVLPMDNIGAAARHVRKTFTAEKSAEYAQGYLDILRQGHDNPQRVVDKLPGNSRFVGLIKSLFPNATIIHAMRHPLDICLSCFFQNFENLWWTVNLGMIGEIYNGYRKSMEYWHSVLPEGSIIDIHYEDLVEDPETHARRLIDACGLEWDPTVLEFYRKKGVVRTASIAQTRRKIYKSSRARWMNYAEHLGPLVDEIAPYLEFDRERLAEHGIELPKSGGLLRKMFG